MDQEDVNLMKNINLMIAPDKKLVIIMKDGKVSNNTLESIFFQLIMSRAKMMILLFLKNPYSSISLQL